LKSIWKAIVGLAPKRPSRSLLAHTAPLFEEERNVSGFTLFANRKNPILFHRPRARSALAADDDPGDAIQRQLPDVFEKRFHGEETDRCGRCLKVRDSWETVPTILH
jgi:hypothetical protein